MAALVTVFAGASAGAAEQQGATEQARDQGQAADLAQRVKRAQALLEAHQAQQAYALLSEVEFDGAGSLEFDYTLGIAALDAGKPDKATLAFDRVLALNANHAGALVDRGRAHAALGNLADARADFDAALKLNPSAATRAQLEAFLAQLDRRESVAGAKVKGYLAATLGHDSNVNFAASERNVFVPLLQDSVQLSADSVRQRDAFLGLNGGIALDYVLNPRFAWFANLDATTKRNQDMHQFHLSSLDARFGPAWSRERFQLRLALGLGAMQLGDVDYRKHHGAGLEWRYSLNESMQLVAALQQTRYRYRAADAKVFDTNQSVGLLGLSFLIDKDKQAVVSPYLLGGYEDDTGGNLQGNKRVAGAGVSGRWGLTASRSLAWNIGAQRGSYDKTDPFFLKKRTDKRLDVSLALNQQLGKGKHWLLRPQVTWTRQRSNLAPYDFKRAEAGLTLRRDF
jgi:outer membrane protein